MLCMRVFYREGGVLISAMVMIGVGILFFLSYVHEERNFIFKWIMRFSTQVHILPSARGKRYWALFYGVLALMWGIGGVIFAIFS